MSKILKRLQERSKEIKKLWEETKDNQGHTIIHIPADVVTVDK